MHAHGENKTFIILRIESHGSFFEAESFHSTLFYPFTYATKYLSMIGLPMDYVIQKNIFTQEVKNKCC